MSNSITFKGISSNTISGLLISELPPITKPKMRVKETVIDGVDGSLLEDLGYESYSKKLNIGLTRNFDIDKIINYDETKINSLLNNKDIVRNKLKINATINNALIFKTIEKENGSFKNYILKYFRKYPIYEVGKTTSVISDNISNDLKLRGMKFVGSTIIYSYLQAIGLINSHENDCFLYLSSKNL